MSFQSSIAKLQAPLRDLVQSATGNGSKLLGQTEQDQADIVGWIDKAGDGVTTSEENIEALDTLLVPRTYIVNNYLTAADVALYGALHPTVGKLPTTRLFSLPSLTRYFDHIQSRPEVRAVADGLSFAVIPIDLANAPALERKVEAPKKKEKSSVAATPAAAASVPAEAATSEEKQPKKEKKEKKKAEGEEGGKKKQGGGAAKATSVAADDGEPAPSMIDLRVGHIVDIKKHLDADGLYVEQIDLGEETGPRTIVSGLVNYIPIEQMRDKYLVAVCNLKPASMRGVKSFGMVLCATSKEGKEGGIELVQPPANSKPGDRVYFEGEEYEAATPVPQLNPKKKIFETIQPGFTTLDTKEAAWVNPTTKTVHRIRTKEGFCIAPTFVGASLS